MEKVSFADCFTIIRNGANIKQDTNSNGIPITRIESIANGKLDFNKFGYGDIFDEQRYQEFYLKKGDILMSHINSLKHLAKTALIERDLNKNIIHGMNLLMLRTNERLLPNYVKYYFITELFKNDILKIANQSVNQCSFSISNFKKLYISLPPLNIQKKIAARLDKADEIRNYNKQIIEKYDTLIQSLFLEMFGDPVKNEKGWEKQNLNFFAKNEKNSIVDGPFGSSIKEADYVHTGIPIIRINNIRNNEYYDNEYKYLTEDKYLQLIRSKVDYEDIIMARVGNTIGKSCIFKEKFKALLSTTGVCKISIDQEKFNLIFIAKQLTFPSYKKYITDQVQGAGQPYLNLTKIKGFELINPAFELQNQFAERVQKIEAQKQLAQETLAKSEALFNSLLQQSFKS